VSEGSSSRSSATLSRASAIRPSSEAAIAMTRSVEACVRFARSDRRASINARSYSRADNAAVAQSES